jgi:hypothetical protein
MVPAGLLAAFLHDVAEELTDRSMDFHRRMIGRMFRESEKQQWAGFVDQSSLVNAPRSSAEGSRRGA